VKLVREHINEKFVENSDPVKDLQIGKEGIFKDLEKRGVRMWFQWDGGEEEKKKVIENIDKIEKVVNKLIEVGFDIKDMEISHVYDIRVKTVQVLDSNHVIFNCASKEDAEILINVAKNFSLWKYDNFNLSEGETTVSVHPEHHKWLDNLIENRKKYKNLQ
jgi:hypothetical protein